MKDLVAVQVFLLCNSALGNSTCPPCQLLLTVVELSVVQVDLHSGDDLLRGRPFLFHSHSQIIYLSTEFLKPMMLAKDFETTRYLKNNCL